MSQKSSGATNTSLTWKCQRCGTINEIGCGRCSGCAFKEISNNFLAYGKYGSWIDVKKAYPDPNCDCVDEPLLVHCDKCGCDRSAKNWRDAE